MQDDPKETLVFLVRRGQGYAEVNLSHIGATVLPGAPFEVPAETAKVLKRKYRGQIVQVMMPAAEDEAEQADTKKRKR